MLLLLPFFTTKSYNGPASFDCLIHLADSSTIFVNYIDSFGHLLGNTIGGMKGWCGNTFCTDGNDVDVVTVLYEFIAIE
jgi:hypothetical protein